MGEHPDGEGFVAFARMLVRRYDWHSLGVAFLIPVFEVFRRTSFDLTHSLAEVCGDAGYIASLVAGAVVGLSALLASAMRGKKIPSDLRVYTALILSVAAFALLALALCAPWAARPVAMAASVAATASVSCAFVVLAVGWIEAYASYDPLVMAPSAALAILVGNLAQPILVSGVARWPLAVFMCACLAASGVVLLLARRGDAVVNADAETSAPPQESAPQDLSDSAPEPEPETRRPSEVVRHAANPTSIGFVLCFFAWGVMAVPPVSYARDHSWFVYLVGNALALAFMLAFSYSLRSTPRYAEFRQKAFFVLPVFAVFVAYFAFIRMLALDSGGALKTFLSIGYNMAAPGLFSLFVALSALQVREKGVSAELVCAPTFILGVGVYVLGVLSFELLANHAMYILVVIATLYILGLSFISARKASLDDSQVERRCAALAQECGLSAREAEILQLVAADYTVERIADELTISPATVRTHKKRVYAKLDVHKHEELMRLVRSSR